MAVAESAALLACLTLQRLAELVVSQRNTRALLARGAYEEGAEHYPMMIAFHATWLVTLWLFGWGHSLRWPLVIAVLVLQIGRFWVIRTLGERWTTRIIMVPGSARVTSGPFRFLRHPNYLIVAFELPLVSLALGLAWHAIVFGALGLAVLARRIRAEDAAFARLVSAGT